MERTLSQLLPGANKVENALGLRTKAWKRHLEELSTEDVVLLGAVLRVFPNGVSGSAGLSRREHLM